MYQAKQSGKNRIQVFEADPPKTLSAEDVAEKSN